jgi:peptide/nickel transport system permease protein
MKMANYIIFRIISLIFQLAGALFVTFAILNVLPYDPTLQFRFFFQGSKEEEDMIVAQMRENMGIDQPFYVQFFLYIKHIFFESSLGNSWTLTGETVNDLLIERLPVTFLIFGLAFVIYTPLSILLGIFTSTREGTSYDKLAKYFTTFTYAVPSYVIGLWLVVWGTNFNLAPWLAGEDIFSMLKYGILPIFTAVIAFTGYQFRLVRSQMIEILRQRYILTARAKGLTERMIIYKHAVRNAIPRIITTIAVTFPIAFSGVAVLEVIFGIPGVGNLMVYAAAEFDWPIIIGATTVFLLINGIMIGLTDILFRAADPRLRIEG